MSGCSAVNGQRSVRNKNKNSLRLTFQLLLLTVSAIYLAGCAARQEIRPSKTLPAAGDIIRSLEENLGKVRSLKGMASVKIVHNDKNTSAKEVLVVKKPSQVRAETIGLFGNPVFVLVMDGPAFSIHKPAENIFFKGNISSHEMQLPFPLNELGAEELANILLGGTSLIKYNSSDIRFSEDEKAYILTLGSPDGFKKQAITIDARNLQLTRSDITDGERGTVVSFTFGKYQDVGNLSFPKEIKGQFLDKADTLEISYDDIELNTEVADELFVLTPP